MQLTEQQSNAIKIMLGGKNVFITGKAGYGKCLKKGTDIIMYDGNIKKIEDIHIGELVLGDDSTPRKVLSVSTGIDIMFKVTNVNGESYTVNSDHILSLKYSGTKCIVDQDDRKSFKVQWFNPSKISLDYKTFSYANTNKELVFINASKFLNDIIEDRLVDIPIKHYMNLKGIKRYLKGYSVPITFNNTLSVDFDPYIIGLWLGDGTSTASSITNQDSTILHYLANVLPKYKCYLKYAGKYLYRINGEIKINHNRCMENPFVTVLKNNNLIGNKHIPHLYKCNTRENRLKLLAGIIDSDGHLFGNCYEICQSNKHERLLDDIIYLCRSLGFSCYKSRKNTTFTYKNIKTSGTAWRIIISGSGLEDLPCLVPRKKAHARIQIKDTLMSGISIKELTPDTYYGFELDGNHRFVMGNFIVSHNSTVINRFVDKCKELKIKIAVTASTGIAAINIGGTTLHFFVGAGLITNEPEILARKILRNKTSKKRWNDTSVLVIDEISMIDSVTFDRIEKIARLVRRKNVPFGGIQVILCGDMGQLPPISKDSNEIAYVFKSNAWNYIDNHICLSINMRQTNDKFSEVLGNIRSGKITDEVKNYINGRIGLQPDKMDHVRIYTHNIDVNSTNRKELDVLLGNGEKEQIYKSVISVLKPEIITRDYVVRNSICNDILSLCVNCKVMLLCNLDVKNKLVNGSVGFISGFTDTNEPIVNFNGMEVMIEKYTWDIEENNEKLASITQYPLKLAYCVTVHKCVNENTLIFTDRGIKRISKISSDMMIPHDPLEAKEISQNIMGKTGIVNATQIYKGETKDTIRITTACGFVIEGSNHHPVMTYNGEEIWKTIPEIMVGDSLMLKNNIQSFGTYIDTSSFKIINNTSMKSKTYKTIIPPLVEEKLCYIIGLLIGDGCTSTKNKYPIELTVSKLCTNIRDTYMKYFYDIFNKQCGLYERKTVYNIKTNSKEIRDFLYWCGIYYTKAGLKQIPWVIFENTRESQIACIKGLFDSDGGVSNIIHYTSISHQLVIDLQILLMNLGILSTVTELNGISRKSYKQAYRLQISGFHAHLFYLYVGFHDKRKQDKLTLKFGKYNYDVPKTQSHLIPKSNNLIKNFRQEIYSFYGNTKRCNNLSGKCSTLISGIIRKKIDVSHVVLKYICDNIPDIDKYGPNGTKIKYICENNLFFDKVKTIENKTSQVYDLYVPGDHTFVGNGVINHNCQSMTFDNAIMDVSKCFGYGMLYTALSRVRTIDGLFLENNINWDNIKLCSSEILQFL